MQLASFGWTLSIVPPLRFDRFFHAVVVMGAALPGCGGKQTDDHTASPSGVSDNTGDAGTGDARVDAVQDAAKTDGPVSASDCASPAQFFCADDAGTGCYCDASAPKTASECANPFQFQCSGLGYFSQSGGFGSEQPVGCRCNAGALTPDQCPQAVQFTCTTYDPYFEGCRCDPSAPSSAADCADAGADAQTAGLYLQFRCVSQSPMYGCSCEYVVPIK